MDHLHEQVQILQVGPASKGGNIDSLTRLLSWELPADYRLFLAKKTDIEYSLQGAYLRLWGADGCLELNQAYRVGQELADALAIGDDGGGGLLLYLTGQEGFGLYYGRAADLDEAEMVKIADSLHDLLVEGKGVTEFGHVS